MVSDLREKESENVSQKYHKNKISLKTETL